MGRSMACELGIKRIRVNTISPGHIYTKYVSAFLPLALCTLHDRAWRAPDMAVAKVTASVTLCDRGKEAACLANDYGSCVDVRFGDEPGAGESRPLPRVFFYFRPSPAVLRVC